MFHFLVLLASSFLAASNHQFVPPPAPAINFDAIHPIYCKTSEGFWQGTGFMIAPNTIATANHVVSDNCIDVITYQKLHVYKQDRAHDFALMEEQHIEYGPYLHYNCLRPVPGKDYISYGYSAVSLPDFFHPILRSNPIEATAKFEYSNEAVVGSIEHTLMRDYKWAGVEGTSGGPVADIFGNVVAINNAGNNATTVDYDLADTGLCTGKWDY